LETGVDESAITFDKDVELQLEVIEGFYRGQEGVVRDLLLERSADDHAICCAPPFLIGVDGFPAGEGVASEEGAWFLLGG